jgi:hypothetical protein
MSSSTACALKSFLPINVLLVKYIWQERTPQEVVGYSLEGGDEVY